MGIREKMNQNPGVTTGVTVGVIVIALIFIVWQLWPSSGPRIPTKAFYTVDDGKTYFPDDIKKVPPFDHEGKQAVRAYVFKCGSTKFVAYLEMYTPDAKAKLEKARAEAASAKNPQGMPPDMMMMPDMMQAGVLVKKPGQGNWVSQADFQKSQSIMQVKCPDGKTTDLEPVMPD
jgi:hypothetical protein